MTKKEAIDSIIPMIYKIARKFAFCFNGMSKSKHDPVEDLVQEGCIGALTAWDRFDPSNGAKFSSYAYRYIFSAIQQYVASNYGICKQPHTKITDNYRSVEFEADIMEEDPIFHVYNDAETELTSKKEDVKALFTNLTPLEQNAINVEYALIEEDQYLEAKPLHKLLLKSGYLKLKRFRNTIV